MKLKYAVCVLGGKNRWYNCRNMRQNGILFACLRLQFQALCGCELMHVHTGMFDVCSAHSAWLQLRMNTHTDPTQATWDRHRRHFADIDETSKEITDRRQSTQETHADTDTHTRMQVHIVCYSNISIQAGLIRPFFARLAQIDFRFIRFQSIRFRCIGINGNSFGRRRFCVFARRSAYGTRSRVLWYSEWIELCRNPMAKKRTHPCVCAISLEMVVAWSLFDMQTLQTPRWWGKVDTEKRREFYQNRVCIAKGKSLFIDRKMLSAAYRAWIERSFFENDSIDWRFSRLAAHNFNELIWKYTSSVYERSLSKQHNYFMHIQACFCTAFRLFSTFLGTRSYLNSDFSGLIQLIQLINVAFISARLFRFRLVAQPAHQFACVYGKNCLKQCEKVLLCIFHGLSTRCTAHSRTLFSRIQKNSPRKMHYWVGPKFKTSVQQTLTETRWLRVVSQTHRVQSLFFSRTYSFVKMSFRLRAIHIPRWKEACHSNHTLSEEWIG